MSKQMFLKEVSFIKLDCYCVNDFLYVVDKDKAIARVSLSELNEFSLQFKKYKVSQAIEHILVHLLYIFSNTPIEER